MQKKIVIEAVVCAGRCGVARACRLFGLARSALYRRGAADPAKATQEGMVAETSRAFPTLGYRKVAAILRSYGEVINVKRVARLRRRDGLEASRRLHEASQDQACNTSTPQCHPAGRGLEL